MKNLNTNKLLEKSCLLTKNLLAAFPIAHYSGTGTAEPSLIIKKRELSKTFLYISHPN